MEVNANFTTTRGTGVKETDVRVSVYLYHSNVITMPPQLRTAWYVTKDARNESHVQDWAYRTSNYLITRNNDQKDLNNMKAEYGLSVYIDPNTGIEVTLTLLLPSMLTDTI